jgi:polysaccharide export outer membrane protein
MTSMISSTPARRLAGIASLVCALAGCASSASLPPVPQTADAPETHYRIGPMDVLNIVVWHNPELSGPVTVRPDGFVSLPLTGDLQAAGHTPAELSTTAKDALKKFVRDPDVSVIVTGFQGVYADQIRIVGEAARPQAVPYRRDMTLLDVMIQVGGMTDFADGNNAVLIRGSQNGKQFHIRLTDLLKRGDISANAAVLPGDIVMVPQSWF